MAAVIIPQEQLRIPEHLRGRLDRPALRVVAAPGAHSATVVPLRSPGLALRAPGVPARVPGTRAPARLRGARADSGRSRRAAATSRPVALLAPRPAERESRRRSAATLVVAACMAVVALTGITALATGAAAPAVSPAAVPAASPAGATAPVGGVWVVQPGDSLWSIAAAVAPGADLRPVVDELAQSTGGGSLQPGQRIPVDGLTP